MLTVQMTKRPGGGSVLRCVRADGSVTWQKPAGESEYYALHDLTHFGVESELGFRRGFFGLIASGWDIDDTTGKGKRGCLPEEAGEVEFIAGCLDRERASGHRATASELNGWAALHAGAAPRRLSEEELTRVRTRCAELFAQWRAIPPGSTLELRSEF